MELKPVRRLATFGPTKWAANLITNPRIAWKAFRGTIKGSELSGLAEKFQNRALFSKPWEKDNAGFGKSLSYLFGKGSLLKNFTSLAANILPQSFFNVIRDHSHPFAGPFPDPANAASWSIPGGIFTFLGGHGVFQVGRLAGQVTILDRGKNNKVLADVLLKLEPGYRDYLLGTLKLSNANRANALTEAVETRRVTQDIIKLLEKKTEDEAAKVLHEKLISKELTEEAVNAAIDEFGLTEHEKADGIGKLLKKLKDSQSEQAEMLKAGELIIEEKPPVEITNANAAISGANGSAEEALKTIDEVSKMVGVGTQRIAARTATDELLKAVKSLEDEIAFGVLDANRQKVVSLTGKVNESLAALNEALAKLNKVVAEERDPVLKLKSEREDLKKQFKSIEDNIKLFWKDLKPSQIKWLQEDLEKTYNHLRIAKEALGNNNVKTAGAELNEARKKLNTLSELTGSSTKAKESIPEASTPATAPFEFPPLDQTPTGPNAFAAAEISGEGKGAAGVQKTPAQIIEAAKRERTPGPGETVDGVPVDPNLLKDAAPAESETGGLNIEREPAQGQAAPPARPVIDGRGGDTKVVLQKPQMSNVERAKQAMQDMKRLQAEYQELFKEIKQRLGNVPELAEIIKKMEENRNGLTLKEVKQLMIVLINLRQMEKLTSVDNEALNTIVEFLRKPSEEAFGKASDEIAKHKDSLLTELLSLAKASFDNFGKLNGTIADIERDGDLTISQKDKEIRRLMGVAEAQKAMLEPEVIEQFVDYRLEANFGEGLKKVLNLEEWFPLFLIYQKEVPHDKSGKGEISFGEWFNKRPESNVQPDQTGSGVNKMEKAPE